MIFVQKYKCYYGSGRYFFSASGIFNQIDNSLFLIYTIYSVKKCDIIKNTAIGRQKIDYRQ